ncbi:MAG: bifunctional phosphoribosylaminoimidazolecarboxamide formyltransferase/IMP cyclohydrolase [Nitrospinales bacterium]
MNIVKRALISVSDKTGVAEFARRLSDRGVEILSTGGTAALLRDQGVPVLAVSDYTGFPEIMDGRIKTLHPKIHGGILAKRDLESHRQALQTHQIRPIDLVAINLYPFEATVSREDCSLDDAVENIDIGGPTMVRAAAKNFHDVAVVVNPSDYDAVLKELDDHDGAVTLRTRQRLSRDAFAHTARYDSLIAAYLSGTLEDAPRFSPWFHPPFEKIMELRYGENPHQQAAFYRETAPRQSDIVSAEKLQGKELSFNNIIDLNAAWELVREFESSAVVIIKHTNPCGVALGEDQLAAFIQARETDPASAFGGIIGFNRTVTAHTAEEMLKNFVEAVVAPGFEPQALALFAGKKNIRLMEVPGKPAPRTAGEVDLKRVGGGLLVQDMDAVTLDPDQLQVVTQKQPDERQLDDLRFAWTVAKHVKSNAIIYAQGGETVGIGAGQMSRVDSARLAIEKAHKPVAGCVMASDAFFPFRDSVDAAAQAGVAAIIQPGGSIRDREVIQAADEHGLAMVFTGIRHFKH